MAQADSGFFSLLRDGEPVRPAKPDFTQMKLWDILDWHSNHDLLDDLCDNLFGDPADYFTFGDILRELKLRRLAVRNGQAPCPEWEGIY